MAGRTDLSDRLIRFKSGQPPPTVQIIGLLKKETPPGLTGADIARELQLKEHLVEETLHELSSLGAIEKEGSLFSISDSRQAREAVGKLLRFYDRLAARAPVARILKGILDGGPLEESALKEAARLVPLDERDLAPVLDAELKAWRVGLIKLLFADGELKLIGMSRRLPKPGTLSIKAYEMEKQRLSASAVDISEKTFYAGFYPPEAMREAKAILLEHFPEVVAYLKSKRRSMPAFPKWL